MRKNVVILGALLIAAVFIISGSAVAASHFAVDIIDEVDCTNPENILYGPDTNYATIGKTVGMGGVLGLIMVDFGEGNEMSVGQNFTVYTGGGETEYFKTWILEDLRWESCYYMGERDDQSDQEFQTPAGEPGTEWRYVFFEGTTGLLGGGDMDYGPEIDAGLLAISDSKIKGEEIDALYIGNMSAGRLIDTEQMSYRTKLVIARSRYSS